MYEPNLYLHAQDRKQFMTLHCEHAQFKQFSVLHRIQSNFSLQRHRAV